MGRKVKTLVLTVDRDDDLGKKAKIKGPIVGEKDCLNAAEALALADPTDSDVNAMFQAIKTFKELKKSGESVEVAIVTGHPSRGIRSDREVRKQVEALKDKLGFEDVILVSDGADDEQIIPVLQSVAKIANVQTVIVKQAKEIEKSYYVIKEVLRDPHFARLIFGLPGIVLLIYALVYLFGIEKLSLNIVIGLTGFYLMIKGFGIEEATVKWFSSFRKTTSIERASFPVYVSSLLIILLSIWAGIDYTAHLGSVSPITSLVGFLDGCIGLLTLAISLFFIGRIMDMYQIGEVARLRKYSKSIFTAVSAYLILDTTLKFILGMSGAIETGPSFLDFLFAFVLAILVTLIGFSLVNHLYKKVLLKHIKKGIPVYKAEEEIGVVSGLDTKKGLIKISSKEEEKKIPLKRVVRLTTSSLEIS